MQYAGDGTVLVNGQSAGDCRELQCDGMGGTKTAFNPSDRPAPQNECHAGDCNGGQQIQVPIAGNCSQGGSSASGARVFSSESVSRHRVRVRAWRIVWYYVVCSVGVYGGLALLLCALGLAPKSGYDALLSKGPAPPTIVAGGLIVAPLLFIAAYQYYKARWPRDLRAVCPDRRKTSVAEAPRDGATAVVLEGRVAYTAQGPELRAPISGAPCTYYRVRLEEWSKLGGAQGRSGWWGREDSALFRPFVVKDDSGFVRIDPVVHDSQPLISTVDSVDFDLESVSRVAVHESTTGIPGLIQEARAYVESHLGDGVRQSLRSRLRVIEVYLREGDVVSVFGAVKNETAPAGPFRGEGAERTAVMSGFPNRVRIMPASLEEIRWVTGFHFRVVLGLLGAALLALGSSVLAFVRMVQDRGIF